MADLRIMVVSSIPPVDPAAKGPQWADLAQLTCATQMKYCDLHGYGYDLNVSNIDPPLSSPWVDQSPSGPRAPLRTMVKFPLLLHYLDPEKCGQVYDHVVWMDADCLVTNYDVPLEKFLNGRAYDPDPHAPAELGDVIMCENVDGLHPTIFTVRNTVLGEGVVWHCSQAGDRMFRQHGWSDIMAWRFALQTPPYRDIVWYHPISALCAEHPGAYKHPKRMLARYEWTPESLTLHLSAMSIAKRIEIAQEYVERLGLL